MKINAISFGRTYLEPSYRNLNQEDREKIEPLYDKLNAYTPNEVVLGAKGKDLKVSITKGSLTEYLLVNDKIENNKSNQALAELERSLLYSYENVYGKSKYPKEVYIVNNLDIKNTYEIGEELLANVDDYDDKHNHLYMA